MAKLYEGMFLLDSGQFASDPDGLSQSITDLLQKFGGEIAANRPWQDGRLAYEIKGRRKGLHFLTYFKMEPDQLKALNRACKLNERILRHMFIQQPPVLFDAMVTALNPPPPEDEPADAATEDAVAVVADAPAEGPAKKPSSNAS